MDDLCKGSYRESITTVQKIKNFLQLSCYLWCKQKITIFYSFKLSILCLSHFFGMLTVPFVQLQGRADYPMVS